MCRIKIIIITKLRDEEKKTQEIEVKCQKRSRFFCVDYDMLWKNRFFFVCLVFFFVTVVKPIWNYYLSCLDCTKFLNDLKQKKIFFLLNLKINK